MQQEYMRKKATPDPPHLVLDAKSLPIVAPIVPLQTNSCDCGVFTIVFAEKFLKDRQEKDFVASQIQTRRKFTRQFGAKWFPLDTIPKRRIEMAEYVEHQKGPAL